MQLPGPVAMQAVSERGPLLLGWEASWGRPALIFTACRSAFAAKDLGMSRHRAGELEDSDGLEGWPVGRRERQLMLLQHDASAERLGVA